MTIYLSGINEHALAFWLGGAIRNFKYSGNRIENARHGLILMRTNWNDFYAGQQSGSADNIVFDRLTAENISLGDGHFNTLEGLNAVNHMNNITFKDFYQGGLLMTSAEAANMAFVGSNVSNINFTTSTTPIIGITASTLITYRKGSNPGRFKVTRTGGNTSGALTIRYQIHGNAINGTDYLTIRDSVTIPAGGISANISITPSARNNASTYVNVYLSLLSSDSYILGPNYDAVVSVVN